LAEEGVDLFVIGQILGHASPQTTARYAHLSDKTLRITMRRIA
jgi:site-specific recombinase XerD